MQSSKQELQQTVSIEIRHFQHSQVLTSSKWFTELNAAFVKDTARPSRTGHHNGKGKEEERVHDEEVKDVDHHLEEDFDNDCQAFKKCKTP